MTLGERLKELRLAKKLKQTELAELLGVTSLTIIRWEAGTTEPRYSDLMKLTEVLNVSVDELMTGKTGGTIKIHHGPVTLEVPATEEGYEFLRNELKEVTARESLPAASLKAG